MWSLANSENGRMTASSMAGAVLIIFRIALPTKQGSGSTALCTSGGMPIWGPSAMYSSYRLTHG